jgi:transcriptional regulator with XRE-family HTH domain
MSWRKELGLQVRTARTAKRLSQQELALKTSVTREQISNIENGKSAPAVNIVTEIAAALDTVFIVGGYQICSVSTVPKAAEAPSQVKQLSLAFDIDHRFHAASIRLDSVEDETVIVSLRLAQPYKEIA